MKARRLAVGLATFVLGLAIFAPAQQLSVSAAAGSMFPLGDVYRTIYGSSLVVAGDVWFKLKGPFGLATGFALLSDEGAATGPTDQYPVRFRRRTIPLVLFYQFDVGPVDFRLGAGVGIHHFRETWQTVDLDYSGNKASPRALLSVSVEVVKRLSLFSSVTYDTIRKERRIGQLDHLTTYEVNMDGVQVVGGLCFRIF
jgi:hypothetical protein